MIPFHSENPLSLSRFNASILHSPSSPPSNQVTCRQLHVHLPFSQQHSLVCHKSVVYLPIASIPHVFTTPLMETTSQSLLFFFFLSFFSFCYPSFVLLSIRDVLLTTDCLALGRQCVSPFWSHHTTLVLSLLSLMIKSFAVEMYMQRERR